MLSGRMHDTHRSSLQASAMTPTAASWPTPEAATRDLLEASIDAFRRLPVLDRLAWALKLVADADPNTAIEIVGNLLQPTLESLDLYQRLRLLGHLTDLADPPDA